MHEGHRMRKKEWVAEHGFDTLPSHELLEIMLYYAIPRADTNELAHTLIERFGNISGVVEAPMEELQEVPGIGFSAALYLKMFSSVMRACNIEKAGKDIYLKDRDAMRKYVISLFDGKSGENLYCICISKAQKVFFTKLLATGFVDRVDAPISGIVKTAVAKNAGSIILAHNHPYGFPLFSHEDCRFTERAAAALSTVGIDLVDHYLVAEGECVSFYNGIL